MSANPLAASSKPHFTLLALAVVAAAFAITVWVASKEWFYGDDFIFLRLAQTPRDWWQIFFPLDRRFWWSYRPLTIEVYFKTLFELAGFNPFPFLLAVLIVHFANGVVVFGIALRLGFERRTALFAGCLSVLMYPSLHEIFWASAFQPVAAIFFYLFSVSCFLAYLQEGRRGWLFGSLSAQLLLAWSNELGVTLPGVLAVFASMHARGGVRERLAATVRGIWPHAAILAVYLVFRFVLLPASVMTAPAFYYQAQFGFHILRNLGSYASILTHDSSLHAAAVGILVIIGWVAAIRSSTADVQRLRRRVGLMLSWMLLAMIPYLGLWYAQHRMVMLIEAPFALLLAAHIDAVWWRWGHLRPRLLEWSMVVLLAVAVPYQTLWQRGREPIGDLNRQIVRLMRTHVADPPRGTCVALRAHDPAAWNPNDTFAVWFVTSGLLSAFYPGAGVELQVPDHKKLREEPPPRCVVIEIVSRNEARFGRGPLIVPKTGG